MSVHQPKTRDAPGDDDYLLISKNNVTLSDDEALITIAMGAENVDLGSFWTRLQHVARSTQSPSVIFVHLDPYLCTESLETAAAVKRAGKEGAFSVSLHGETVPRTLEALKEAVEMSVAPGTMSVSLGKQAGLDMGVSHVGFSAQDRDDLKKAYDVLYKSSKEMKSLREEERELSMRMKQEDDEEAIAKIVQVTERVQSNIEHCAKECESASKTWSDLLEGFLRDAGDKDFIVQHLTEWIDFDGLFSSRYTTADRLLFKAAVMSPEQQAIVFAYHGDINLRKSVVNIGSFVDAWLSARNEGHKMYGNLLAMINDGKYEKDRPDTWPRPERATDYFFLTLPVDRVENFMKKVVDTRTTIESHVQRAVQVARERSASDEDFGSTETGV